MELRSDVDSNLVRVMSLEVHAAAGIECTLSHAYAQSHVY